MTQVLTTIDESEIGKGYTQTLKGHLRAFNKIKFESVMMTPELAQQWLNKNPDINRKLNRHTVNRYKNDILRGEWIPGNGSIITIDINGGLQNGQHRLNAIVETGRSIPMFLMRNVPADAIHVTDTGKNRSVGESVQVAGFKQHSTIRAGIAKTLLNLYGKRTYAAVNNCLTESYLTNADIVKCVSTHENLIMEAADKAVDARKDNPYIAAPLLGSYYIVFSGISKQKANEFFQQYKTGIGYASDKSPIYHLRARLMKDSKSVQKMNPENKISIFIQAWNLFIQDLDGNVDIRKAIPEVLNSKGNKVQDQILKRLFSETAPVPQLIKEVA